MSKRFIFRASEVEAQTIENMAKMFPDNTGQPNYSEGIRFMIQFFIVMSNLQPTESKDVIAAMYDRLLHGGFVEVTGVKRSKSTQYAAESSSR